MAEDTELDATRCGRSVCDRSSSDPKGDGQAASQKLGAIKFLDDTLAGGKVKVKEIQDAAKAHGLSWPTVERAKREIGTIVAERDGAGWCWRKNVMDLREP